MRENMPGSNPAVPGTLVDRGPKRLNTFDATYLTPALAGALMREARELGYRKENQWETKFEAFPTDIRWRGSAPDYEKEENGSERQGVMKAIYAARPTSMKPDRKEGKEGIHVRSGIEEHYLDALSDFFVTHTALWPGTITQKEWLVTVMNDYRAARDIAKDRELSDHTAVIHGRKRAVAAFVAHMGGKEALAEKLRQFLADKDAQDGSSRLHYLPRWCHG